MVEELKAVIAEIEALSEEGQRVLVPVLRNAIYCWEKCEVEIKKVHREMDLKEGIVTPDRSP